MDELKQEKNRIAAMMGIFVEILLWGAVTFSVFVLVLFTLGLVASLNGGAIEIPLGNAIAGGLRPELFAAALASLSVVMPCIIYICVHLRRILGTLADGDPFVPENGPRLLKIACAIVLMEVARYGVILLLLLMVNFDDIMQEPQFSISLAAWVAAAALFIFSQVFREGSRLREEEKMTV